MEHILPLHVQFIHPSVFITFRRNPVLNLVAHPQVVKICKTCALWMHIPKTTRHCLLSLINEFCQKNKISSISAQNYFEIVYIQNVTIFGRYCKMKTFWVLQFSRYNVMECSRGTYTITPRSIYPPILFCYISSEPDIEFACSSPSS